MHEIQVVDSHTEGEPTRVVVAGGPSLGAGRMDERRRRFAQEHDFIRSAVVNEPRGSDVHVGALLCEPHAIDCVAGVIFFNNVGFLSMCGHGTIGVVKTLAHLGRIHPGEHRIETPVGIVETELREDGAVSVLNVPSHRHRQSVVVELEGHGEIVGDVAWGGNWFFLVGEHGQSLELENAETLVDFCWKLRQGLAAAGITGRDGAEIDHIELFAPSSRPAVDSRNFVLCPGKAYDRSPCGTGTSAKLACLFEDGKLGAGEVWRQEGIVGGVFEAAVELRGAAILPRITGRAWITAEATLLLDPRDPFRYGIRR